MALIPNPPGECGLTRLVHAPNLHLSLEEAQELLTVLQRMPGGEGMTMHWQADGRSPEVLVEAQHEHFERTVDKLLNEVGGFGPLGKLAPPDPEHIAHVAGRILIVTPDDNIGEVLVAFLNVMGFDPELVDSGTEAVERIKEQEYDLLVVGNTQLGAMSALEVMSTLGPYLRMTTPVLYWTGHIDVELQEAIAGLGTPLRMLSKPNDFHAFRSAVEECLEWRHMLRLRRHVRRFVTEEVARRVRRIETDLFGAPLEAPATAASSDSVEDRRLRPATAVPAG